MVIRARELSPLRVQPRHAVHQLSDWRGPKPELLAINLLVENAKVATATGEDSEALSWMTWDVRPWKGKNARLQILDKATDGWGHLNLDQIELSTHPKIIDYGNPAISRAMASLHGAIPKAEADPNRPAYHFHPPAYWMNDPNGPIQYKGIYHLFYQYNPYGDTWGNMHWGHARSKDLIHWEHLPIALWPSKEKGEDHVFSGCATIAPDGKPMIFYTSIGRNKIGGDADQWAAFPLDDDLITWKKHPASPLLTKSLHGSTTVHDWRDPFIFKDGATTFMVLGGGIGDGDAPRRGVVNLYESTKPELTEWTYRGVLWTHPELANIECPLFFKLGNRWVLIISPHGKVQTFVGAFDAEKGQFQSSHGSILDEGQVYAPNVFFDQNGRALLWGWVNGFKSGNGWNGCMTLPRVLTLDSDGELMQTPASETTTLRSRHFSALAVEARCREARI